MSSVSRIKELAESIHYNTNAIDDYLKDSKLSSPSFDVDAPDKLHLPTELATAKGKVLDATDELHTLMLGPVDFLTGFNYIALAGLQVIEKYNIASAVPVGEEVSFAQIAQQCGLNEDDTKKVLRQAMTLHIFHEPRKDYVAHTSMSKQIAENPLLRDWIAFMCNECWRAAPRIVDAITKWPSSEEPGHTAWVLANNATAPLTQEIFKYPERLQRMPGAMQIAGQSEGLHPAHMIKHLDWTGVQTFVDVGGAHGSVSIEVVRRVPLVKVIVQDVPPVLASAVAPPDIIGRLDFMPHDFFGPQVVKGADIYFFRWIFHDWSDKYAVRILQNLIPALKAGARIVANDNLLPEPGLLSPYEERPLRNIDLAVKQLVNGKERDAEGWANLFGAADSRFKLQSIQLPAESKLAVIEAIWTGETQF